MKFRLESILSLKKNLEEMKKKELAEAYQEKQILVQRQEALKQTDDILNQQLAAELNGSINPHNIAQVNNYKKTVIQSINKVEKDIAISDKNILSKQHNLVEAMKSRKILDNLKEMNLQQQMLEFRQQEQQLADEIVGYRYIIAQEGGE